MVSGGAACKGSDVFGFGVIMWELMTWREPWDMFQGDDSSDMVRTSSLVSSCLNPPTGSKRVVPTAPALLMQLLLICA